MFRNFTRGIQETPITVGLVVIHSILFILAWVQSGMTPTVAQPPGSHDFFVALWGMMPISKETLRAFGSQHSPLVWEGDYHRLFFSAFLHGNFWHLFLNNLSIYYLGQVIERVLGRFWFGVMYISSLLAGNLASLIWLDPRTDSVGASGAIMGVVGVLAVFLFFDRNERFLQVRKNGRGIFFVLIGCTLLFGEMIPVINNVAHIGGLLGGIAFGIFFWSRIPGESLPRLVGGVSIWLLVGSLGAMGYFGLSPKKNHAWHMYKGLAFFEKGEAEKAEREFLQVLQKKKDPRTQFFLAELYFQTKQWKKAAEIYEQIKKRHRTSVSFWMQWSKSLTESGQHQKAKSVFDEAYKTLIEKKKRGGSIIGRLFTGPNNPRSHSIEKSLQHAHLLSSVRRDKQALLIYQQLLEEVEELPKARRAVMLSRVRNSLAWSLLTAHDAKYRNAKLALRHVLLIKNKDQSAAILDTLATAYFKNGMPKKAVAAIKRAKNTPDATYLMPYLRLQEKRFAAKVPKSSKKPKKRVEKRVKAVKKRADVPPKQRKDIAVKKRGDKKKTAIPKQKNSKPSQASLLGSGQDNKKTTPKTTP